MRRVSVVGCSGSGKSTLARLVAGALGLPCLELDAIRHQPGWRELPDGEFAAQVGAFVAGDGWVVDGNYSVVREPLVWPAADTVVWLDLPRPQVMTRLVTRSVRRVVLRQELWNGNREQLRNLLAWDPERSIIRWSWTRHAVLRQRYAAAMDDAAWSHLRFVRLRSGAEVRSFVAGLPERAPSPAGPPGRPADRWDRRPAP